jgi:hypothetical protein
MNVLLTWSLPVPSPTQRTILHTKIEFRISENVPWTLQDIVNAGANPNGSIPDQKMLFVDFTPGRYFFRSTYVYEDYYLGIPVEAQLMVPFDPPESVVDFAAGVV